MDSDRRSSSPRWQVQRRTRQTLNVVVRTFPDKQTVDIPNAAVAGPVRVFGGSTTPVTWDEQLAVGAGESLEWTVDLQLQSVPPGVYVLEVVLSATDDNGANIWRVAPSVALEIRDGQDDQTAVEIAVRSALRLAHERGLTEALEVATDATVRFPRCVLLHFIVGDLYEQLKRRADASRSYSRALAIIETGQEYPMPVRPRDARETVGFLRTKIAELR